MLATTVSEEFYLKRTIKTVNNKVAYFSRTLSKPERRYAVTRKEMLAVLVSLKHF